MNGVAPALVLGGTGFIGSHLVDRLAVGEADVRAASRHGRWPWGEPRPRAGFLALDLTAPDAGERLKPALDGVRTVFNVTGFLLRPGVPDDHYRRLHVGGTETLLEALTRAGGGRRLVHVSTTGVLGPTGGEALDESAPLAPVTVYERTKAEGETLARSAHGSDLGVIIARPGLVFGPRDLHLLGLFRAIQSGVFRLIGGGHAGWQPVAAGDVAAGLVALAAAPQAAGRTFHLAGATLVTLARFAEAIADALGTRVRGPSLPRPVAWTLGSLLEAVCLPLGKEPPLSRMRVRTLTEDRRYRIEAAREVAGWQPATPLVDGLAATVSWYRQQGLLEAAV